MIILLISLFGLNFSAQCEDNIDLKFDKLQNLLEVKNGEVESAKLNFEAADNRSGYLRRKFTPTFFLEGGGEHFSTGPYNNLTQPYGSAIVNLNAFNGGRDSFQNEIIKTEINQRKVEYNQKTMDELLKLRKLFWQFLYEKEVVQILTLANEINTKNLSSALSRIRGGIATTTDQIEFEQNALQVNQDLQRASMELKNVEREIKAILVTDEGTTLSTIETIPHEHADEIISRAFVVENHRDNLWLVNQQNIFEQQRKTVRNWWVPSLDFYASAAHFTQKDRDYLTYNERSDFTLGFKLTINIFDGGESFNQTKSFYLQRMAIEKQSLQKKAELSAAYKNAKALLELTHSQIHNAEENVKKSEQYYKNTVSEYFRGIKNSPDVLQASQRLINSRLRLIELKKDYQVSKASLMYALGI